MDEKIQQALLQGAIDIHRRGFILTPNKLGEFDNYSRVLNTHGPECHPVFGIAIGKPATIKMVPNEKTKIKYPKVLPFKAVRDLVALDNDQINAYIVGMRRSCPLPWYEKQETFPYHLAGIRARRKLEEMGIFEQETDHHRSIIEYAILIAVIYFGVLWCACQ